MSAYLQFYPLNFIFIEHSPLVPSRDTLGTAAKIIGEYVALHGIVLLLFIVIKTFRVSLYLIFLLIRIWVLPFALFLF